jgi:reactive chlorine resistance protein C
MTHTTERAPRLTVSLRRLSASVSPSKAADRSVTSTDGIGMPGDLHTANIRLTLSTIDTIGRVVGRYGLVVVIGWIGALKFAAFEARGIEPLVANSPFMGWLYDIIPVYPFSTLLGVFELTVAVLLAIKPLSPRLSVLGSVLAIMLFLATVSFLFTTPGVSEPAGGGFPALSLTGQFLLKDVALLGLSFWTLADSLRAVARRSAAD